MKKYTIGLDFGTLSVRGVLVDTLTGDIIYSVVSKYVSGVMDTRLKVDGSDLPHDFALQDANDYIDSLLFVLQDIVNNGGISVKDIIGIGIDFTSSTILPIKKDMTPLSSIYPKDKHAYVKLWKHHSAEDQAKRISELAKDRNEPWIKRYGGKISSEWMLPKVLEILESAPNIFDETDYFIEAGDYITLYLTGVLERSSCQAGYKDIWHDKDGYPTTDYLNELHPKLKDVYTTKLGGPVRPIGSKQGVLRDDIVNKTGLKPIPVGVAVIDAHVAMPSCQAVNDGDIMMIIGTSSCDILLSKQEKEVEGISGIVKDGAVPGLYAYESGQAAVGDIFDWFIMNNVPPRYFEEARKKNISIFQLLEEKLYDIPKDNPHIIALDWWNGNRSILVDPELSGVLVGMTLRTTPEEIYRALIEATGFGKRRILEQYKNAGVPINRIIASGGLATKNKYLMQTYANILNQPIYVTDEEYAGALGAAIFGTLAAGKEHGGYNDINNAAENMGSLRDIPYEPKETKEYNKRYNQYIELHDYFGIRTDLLKRIRNKKD